MRPRHRAKERLETEGSVRRELKHNRQIRNEVVEMTYFGEGGDVGGIGLLLSFILSDCVRTEFCISALRL